MSLLKNYIVGIDNGVTGSIGVINPIKGTSSFLKMPTIKCASYTKDIQHIQRINWKELVENLQDAGFVLIERPMVNPRAFKGTQSAMRALEATLIVMEMLDLDYDYIDSKTWQREFFPSSVIGHDELKKASLETGIKLFPNHETYIRKHGDADGLLIAEYGRRYMQR